MVWGEGGRQYERGHERGHGGCGRGRRPAAEPSTEQSTQSAESRTAPNGFWTRTWISAHLDVVRALVAALEAVAAADQAVPPEAAGGDLWQPAVRVKRLGSSAVAGFSSRR